jgi:putative phosphoribosyl transferase
MNAGYTDRLAAGRALAASLSAFADARDTIVIALPCGGAPVACEVARELRLPLRLLFVRRIRLPGSELSIGSVSMHGFTVLNPGLLELMNADPAAVDAAIRRETEALEAREARFPAAVRLGDLSNRTVILVDDGLATGSTMSAAAQTVRAAGAARVVAAAPVASPAALSLIETVADQFICPLVPEPFYTVSIWYDDFADVTDADVDALLGSASGFNRR